MVFQANIFLLLFGAVQGFLVSAFLLRKRRQHPAHIFLTLFLVVVSLQLLSKVITKIWLMENALAFYMLSYFLPLLVGPAFYLFVKSRINGQPFRWSEMWHAAPFLAVITLIFVLPEGMLDLQLLRRPVPRAILELATLSVYSFFSFRLVNQVDGSIQGTLRQFLIFVVAVEAVIIVTLMVMVKYYGRIPDIRLLFVALTFLVYWVTWKLMTDEEFSSAPRALTVSLPLQETSRYAHSGLKTEEATRIERELRELMEVKKLFTDNSLTIDKLAAQLQTTRHHLSQVLNERLQRSYLDYVGDLRLEEARRLLADPAMMRFTIAALAMDAGFNAVSTFNEAFKKRFGTTPSKFRDQHVKRLTA